MSGMIKNTSSMSMSGSVQKSINESVTYTGYLSRDGSNRIKLKTLDTKRSSYSKLIAVDNTTYTKYTILKQSLVNISLSTNGSVNSSIQIHHYDVNNNLVKTSLVTAHQTTGYGANPMTTSASAGDYFYIAVSGSFTDDLYDFFSLTAISSEESQINSTVNLPISTQQDYYIEAAGNAGQVITANITDIPFIATSQNNLTWDGSGFTASEDGIYNIAGVVQATANFSNSVIHAFVNGVLVKEISRWPSGAFSCPFSGQIKLLANQRLSLRPSSTITLNNALTSHYLTITRLNGRNNQAFVGALAKEQIAILSDIKPQGTNGGTNTANAWVNRDLNTIEGDSSFVSLLSNQFTLAAGEYDLDSESSFLTYASGGQSLKCRLYNVTDSVSVTLGNNYYGAATTGINATIKSKFSISSPKTFAIQYYTVVVRSSNGLGDSQNITGVSEVYTQVKIRKLS